MEQSILNSTKKILGIADDYTAFDLDILTHINTAFTTLTQLGIGPVEGFMIEDDSAEWADFIEVESLSLYNSVKSYVFLKVRMLFDPPTTSYLIASTEKQIQELEVRLNIQREGSEWVNPNPIVYEDSLYGDPVVIDGGGP